MFLFFKNLLFGLVILFFNDMLKYWNNFLNERNIVKKHANPSNSKHANRGHTQGPTVNCWWWTLIESKLPFCAAWQAQCNDDRKDAQNQISSFSYRPVSLLSFAANPSSKLSKLTVDTSCPLLNPFLSVFYPPHHWNCSQRSPMTYQWSILNLHLTCPISNINRVIYSLSSPAFVTPHSWFSYLTNYSFFSLLYHFSCLYSFSKWTKRVRGSTVSCDKR